MSYSSSSHKRRSDSKDAGLSRQKPLPDFDLNKAYSVPVIPERKRTCFFPDCKLVYSSLSSFQFHIKSHFQVVPGSGAVYICPVCKRTFKAAYWLITHHERDHLKLKPYVCDVGSCKERFYNRVRWLEHVAWHNGKWRCYECDKEYKIRHTLTRHLKKVHETTPAEADRAQAVKRRKTKWVVRDGAKPR
ncbi:hypothetical protein BDZ45DRAFT_768094 [Acephala macrosclerotiorum]|nr:hypothetical protein BDZ45DRAFT_768094 [Acephala macrosclerotiorum]